MPRKYGKEASILFEGIDLENEPEYIRKLISEPYRKKIDFNLIEPSCDFSSYELRNSIIMNRQAIQIHQMDILSQFSAEIDTLKNAMTCELKKNE